MFSNIRIATTFEKYLEIPYSRKIWQGIKFGSLGVYLCNRQIKISQYFILAYIIRNAIPYKTTKFKSTSIIAMAICGPTTKFNSC